jgi:hypothetical protein
MLLRKKNTDSWELLEQEGNDDLLLLMELGPEHFEVDHLMDLRRQLGGMLNQYEKRQRLAMLFACIGVFWVVLAMAARSLNMPWVVVVASMGVAISVGAYLFMLLWPAKGFMRKGELVYTLKSLEDELRRRTAAYPSRLGGAKR